MNPRSESITAAGKRFAVQLEQAEDGWLAYPENINGVVIGQGDTAAEALEDLRSAISFHLDTFAPDTQPAFPSEPCPPPASA
jgi:predicted RNase H-like HicB family nuclease